MKFKPGICQVQYRGCSASYPVQYTADNTGSTEMLIKRFPTRFSGSASFLLLLTLFISVEINADEGSFIQA